MGKDILYPLKKLHGYMYEAKKSRIAAKSLKAKLLETKKETAFFVLSPTHGNMGDHAIAEAVTNMLAELGIEYLEITSKQLVLLDRFDYLNALDRHLILVNGGGNLGTLWPDVERLFRKIIQKNPDASIVCLPNTIYYEDSRDGKKALEKSRRIYNVHPRLKLYARERISYVFMKTLYLDVELTPDMALFLNHCIGEEKRTGCMICLRTDCEKTITDEMERSVAEQAVKLFGSSVWRSDMNIGVSVSLEERNAALERKYSEFRSAELVITDRLHGMIFAAITGTPCVVINSKSPKVTGCYEWIRGLGYIEFTEDVRQISLLYRQIRQKNYTYSNESLLPFYEQLKQTIRQEMETFYLCQEEP